MNSDVVTLADGEGGKASQRLIDNVFIQSFSNNILRNKLDSSPFDDKYFITTDSFIVKPIFFPGGDIGKLAICGTLNDLAALGAEPTYFSVAFVIEEGFKIDNLMKIVNSMKELSLTNGIKIICGDTKVAPKGEVDGIIINTTGIGKKYKDYNVNPEGLSEGDSIIITGDIARHAAVIVCSREELITDPVLESDCRAVWSKIKVLIDNDIRPLIMRDPTRGGVATALNELSELTKMSFFINENKIPIFKQTKVICDLYGFDPLYLASEGQMLIILRKDDTQKAIDLLGEEAKVIGNVRNDKGVSLKTISCGERIIKVLEGFQLPRIC